jgi:(E)-4-hydroxy-3-methylbut-2-enyl-diphosphate synthase
MARSRESAALAGAGSKMVRITVDREEPPPRVPHIRDGLRKRGITTPLIGDFHYRHKPRRLSGVRRGAGQIPHQSRQYRLQNKRDTQFADIINRQQEQQQSASARLGSLDQNSHQTDGREHGISQPARCTRGDAGDGAVGAAVGRAL